MQVDEAKLNEFMGKAVGEMGAAMNAALVLLGEKLGLYKAMAGAGPLTPADLAKKSNTNERYVREWLNAQAARWLRHLRCSHGPLHASRRASLCPRG